MFFFPRFILTRLGSPALALVAGIALYMLWTMYLGHVSDPEACFDVSGHLRGSGHCINSPADHRQQEARDGTPSKETFENHVKTRFSTQNPHYQELSNDVGFTSARLSRSKYWSMDSKTSINGFPMQNYIDPMVRRSPQFLKLLTGGPNESRKKHTDNTI